MKNKRRDSSGLLVKRYEIISQLNKSMRSKVTFVTAPIGYGKSTAVRMWADAILHDNASIHTIYPGGIQLLLDIPYKSETQIKILEDIHEYSNDELNRIIHYIKDSPIQLSFLLISRGELPRDLKPYSAVRQLSIIQTEAFAFDVMEVNELLALNDITLDDKAVREMVALSEGHILVLNTLVTAIIANKNVWDRSLYDTAIDHVFAVFDTAIWNKCDKRQREFIVKCSLFDVLHMGLITVVTGQADSKYIISDFIRTNSFIIKHSNDSYSMRPLFKRYFQSKAKDLFSESQIAAILANGGLWYRSNGDIQNALHYYFLARDYENAVPLLVEVAEEHAGATEYDKLKTYYTGLPIAMLEKNPVLVGAVCMMHCIYLRLDESKAWYQKLVDLKNALPKNDPQYKVCREKLMYLDIALPWQHGPKVAKTILNTAVLMMQDRLVMQNMAVTGNLPSFLFGGKDFSKWSTQALRMRAVLKPALHFVLGRYGIGSADIGVAETYYERGDLGMALIELTKGMNELENNAAAENWFAGYTLMARIMTASSQLDAVPPILKNIRTKMEHDNTRYLLPNLESVCIRFALYQGDTEQILEWLAEKSPNDLDDVSFIELHRMLTKAKVYILNEQYNHALIVLKKYERFFLELSRTYNLIECKVLQALALAYIDEGYAFETLSEALSIARKYKFTRVFADECGRMYELLNRYHAHAPPKGKDEYMEAVLNDTRKMALAYPNYLRLPRTVNEKLTNTETEVLQLLAQDKSNSEICTFLNISINTVKSHTKSIYTKLGVNSRAMAVKVARENKIKL